MAESREELREHLVAAIEAAPELPKEDREHLADIFLDHLHASYDLLPRRTGEKSQPARPASRRARRGGWVPFVLVLALLVFVLPAAVHAHFPVFLLVMVAVFMALRSRCSSMSRHRPVQR